ncbi:MAG: hypothetical protein DYG89_48915 [Caldilinea sp. CFX5]|nr:hypothetical protein [Caldilinea sp. CFX5]
MHESSLVRGRKLTAPPSPFMMRTKFLRIDPWSNRNAPWQLTGYRLGAGPFYAEIRLMPMVA